MCGIVASTNSPSTTSFLLNGLRRLEYRGYDSAGLAVIANSKLQIRKAVGRVQELDNLIQQQPCNGLTGIGHTRWATHGAVEERNTHPHVGGDGVVAVVHNGVIENHAALRSQLQDKGVHFYSDTDTEVIAQLIAHYFEGDLVQAVQQTLPHLRGTYGIAVISPHQPGLLVGARLGSPLVLGLCDDETYLASDSSAFVGVTDQVIYLGEHQICVLDGPDRSIFDEGSRLVQPLIHTLDGVEDDLELGAFEHYMLKEIYEQPAALENALRGRLDKASATAHFGGLNLEPQQLRQVERIILTACGTSYHAALVGEYLIEELARIPVEVEYASELRYRNPPIDRNTIVIALTQSGETADTLAALQEMKRKGYPTLSLCNVVGSSIAREADGGVYLHAGPEIGVASTKAFTNQVAVLTLLALHFGRLRHLSSTQGEHVVKELQRLPEVVDETLSCHATVRRIAEKYADADNALFLGRHYLYPIALEGALKLKEISYVHAEGYPAAEMKHGPIALVDEHTPSIFLMSANGLRAKVLSNLEEIKARGGPIIAVTSEDDHETIARADDVILVPKVPDYLQPIVAVIPLQLLSYHVALLRGCDVDKPRNLAKSVTVE